MSFDTISLMLVGRPTDQSDLRAPMEAFFFPETPNRCSVWIDMKERAIPAILDILTDLVTEEQRLLTINYWFLHRLIPEYLESRISRLATLDETRGLSNLISVFLGFVYARIRDNEFRVDSDWLVNLIQSKFPTLMPYLAERYPTGATFVSATVNMERLTSNMQFFSVSEIYLSVWLVLNL